MKTGVALSGCDMGGVGAYHVLRLLEKMGVAIAMVSASGMPSLGALCFACGVPEQEYRRMAEGFLDDLRQEEIDTAVARFSDQLNLRRNRPKLPVAINAVHLPDGKAVVFTNAFVYEADNLITYPIEDSYDILSAAVSPQGGLATYPYRGYKLCDYAIWHGRPESPLKLAGLGRMVSVAFAPARPQTPYETLLTRTTRPSAADLALTIAFPNGPMRLEQYDSIAANRVEDSGLRELFEQSPQYA